jgi:alpha-tubulin suppressor-like RCC1 family protein
MSGNPEPRAATNVLACACIWLLVACNQIAGIDARPCAPACADETTRIFCDDRGEPQTQACAAPINGCAATTCRSGQCTFKPRVDEPCGDSGLGVCNEGFACVGPNMALSANHHHTCFVGHDGVVWCWGENEAYELGDGTAEDRGSPVLVQNLPSEAKALSAGQAHTCALLQDGSIACWGSNDRGQCGTGRSSEPLQSPQVVPVSGVNFIEVAAGRVHTCAVSSDGAVYCWGDTTYGQAGVDPSVASGQVVGPTKIDGLERIGGIETVEDHTCATSGSTRTFHCWGSNVQRDKADYIVHKLGPGAAGRRYSAEPVRVDFDDPVLDVGVSTESSYASTLSDVWAWGLNTRELLGVGIPDETVSTPREVLSSPQRQEVVPLGFVRRLLRTGGLGQCVELFDRMSYNSSFLCWGQNDSGELGIDETPVASLPAAARAVPSHTTDLVLGEHHGCAIAPESDGAKIWCYGPAHLIGNGQTSPESGSIATQLQATPVRWSASPFASLPE